MYGGIGQIAGRIIEPIRKSNKKGQETDFSMALSFALIFYGKNFTSCARSLNPSTFLFSIIIGMLPFHKEWRL